jgi:hypothetical protein
VEGTRVSDDLGSEILMVWGFFRAFAVDSPDLGIPTSPCLVKKDSTK